MQSFDSSLMRWFKASSPADIDQGNDAVDWVSLAASADDQGLAGMVIDHADRYGFALPDAIRSGLERRALPIASSNLASQSALESVLAVLNRQRVPVMLLKGAALGGTVYDRPDARPASDVDLLIHREDLDRVRASLAGMGCRRGTAPLGNDFFPKYYYEEEWVTPSPLTVRLDLHVRPLRPMRLMRVLPNDAFWRDARMVQVGKAHALVPVAEDLLIHLAAHAAYHGCPRLIWLYDLKRVVDQFGDSMDWSRVEQNCRDWRLSLPFVRAFETATKHLGPICPQGVVERLSRDRITWRDRLALYHAPRDANSPIGHVLVNLLTTPGLRFRLGYLSALLLPGRDHLAQLYRGRHRGWKICAHAVRWTRPVVRLVSVLGSVFGLGNRSQSQADLMAGGMA